MTNNSNREGNTVVVCLDICDTLIRTVFADKCFLEKERDRQGGKEADR